MRPLKKKKKFSFLVHVCLTHLGRLCASGAKVTSFSSQISSSSEPASSNCWIFSLQRASNKAIFAWRKFTHMSKLECHRLCLKHMHIQSKVLQNKTLGCEAFTQKAGLRHLSQHYAVISFPEVYLEACLKYKKNYFKVCILQQFYFLTFLSSASKLISTSGYAHHAFKNILTNSRRVLLSTL